MIGPNKPELSPAPKTWELPEAIRIRLGEQAGPQRSMFEEGHLLIILHHLPGPDDHDRKPALFWRNPDGDWRSTEGKGKGPVALQDHLDRSESILADLEKAETAASTALEYHHLLEAVPPVLRTARGTHRALQQARDFLKSDRAIISFRDQAAGNERSAELLLQDAQFGLNYTVARQAESQTASAKKMAATAHRLNVLAALFLPLTALTSLFGMDIHSGMSDTSSNFWLILIAGMAVGALLALAIGRRPKD